MRETLARENAAQQEIAYLRMQLDQQRQFAERRAQEEAHARLHDESEQEALRAELESRVRSSLEEAGAEARASQLQGLRRGTLRRQRVR